MFILCLTTFDKLWEYNVIEKRMSLGVKRKLAILLAVGFACYIVGSIRFDKKDLPL